MSMEGVYVENRKMKNSVCNRVCTVVTIEILILSKA
jgi:hypothetical protein